MVFVGGMSIFNVSHVSYHSLFSIRWLKQQLQRLGLKRRGGCADLSLVASCIAVYALCDNFARYSNSYASA